MNYAKYYQTDVLNGLGTRCVLFVSGCAHHCKGCYNQSTWKPDSGHPFTQELADQIITDLTDQRIKRRGITFSGGDPLHPANQADVLALIKRIRAECPGKDVWMWTGYLYGKLTKRQKEIVELVDVLVDGPFVKELADPSLVWRGSSNQEVYWLNPEMALPEHVTNKVQNIIQTFTRPECGC